VITAIKTLVANAQMRNWVFVRVETDQPGLYGWRRPGVEDARGGGSSAGPRAAVAWARSTRYRAGRARSPEHSFWRLGVIGNTAISGIEMALWDIWGKELNVPVWRCWAARRETRSRSTRTSGSAT
jgi:galactonate dehydratase